MKTLLKAAILLTALVNPASAQEGKPHPLTPVPIQHVVIEDDFWSPKVRVWREVTIPDCFTKFENDWGGAINNFDRVRDGKSGGHAGPEWYDGLIDEMIRGSADFLAAKRDAALEARLDGYIEFTAIPYFAWTNCAAAPMRVWLPKCESKKEALR